jgi:uncharacterized membrane protein
VRWLPRYRQSLEALRELRVSIPAGGFVPLAQVADVRTAEGVSFVYREQLERYVPLRFAVSGRDLQGAVDEAKARVAREVHLPEGVHLDWAGEYSELQEAIRRLLIVVPLALVIIVGVLYAATDLSGRPEPCYAGWDNSEDLMQGPTKVQDATPEGNHFRFHAPHVHLSSAFGDDWFGSRAEGFARFFGTPTFLIAQTIIVAVWVGLNVANLTQFDVYPFILLNLAFSLQAAYAAPLILLAQTRQADRDKAHADADAQHREDLARAHLERQELATKQSAQILQLLEQNTKLTEMTRELSERIGVLADKIHRRVCPE